jgi:hypothetical protein
MSIQRIDVISKLDNLTISRGSITVRCIESPAPCSAVGLGRGQTIDQLRILKSKDVSLDLNGGEYILLNLLQSMQAPKSLPVLLGSFTKVFG